MSAVSGVNEKRPVSRATMLAVDDERDNLELVQRVFRSDYDVRVATSGNEALTMLQYITPQVIISDQRMPGMTGIEFLSEAARIHPNAVRIILTGYDGWTLAIDAVQRRLIARFITKPIHPVELRQIIEDTVSIAGGARK